ncbi:hypothetical protein HYS48_03780 [Candidatus Woesearchaeota archaeon]|nr:hypothetical protein [Candidatus Woesearchaeota archaeon]
MPEDEDYDMVPHKKLRELEKQVGELKRNPLGSTASGQTLQESMNRLSDNIEDLTSLFKDAAEQMKLEEKDSVILSKKLEPMMERMDTLIDQNHKIAKGILAVADMIKESIHHRREYPPRSFAPQGPPPGFTPQPRIRVEPRPFTPPTPNPFEEFSPAPRQSAFPEMPAMGEPRKIEERKIPPAPPAPEFLSEEEL